MLFFKSLLSKICVSTFLCESAHIILKINMKDLWMQINLFRNMVMFAKELTKMFICGRQIRQYNDQTDKVASFKGSQVEIRGFGQMWDVVGRS